MAMQRVIITLVKNKKKIEKKRALGEEVVVVGLLLITNGYILMS